MASLTPPTPQYPENKGRSFVGQLIHGLRRVSIPFTQQMLDKTAADALVGDSETEITPNDWDSSQVRVYDTSAIADILEAEWLEVPGKAPVGNDLPDVLTELEVGYETGGGDGDYSEGVIAQATGYLRVSGSVSGTANASAFAIPKIKVTFRPQYRQVFPVRHCYFYMAEPITTALILARLSGATGLNATVLDWPTFRPQGHTLTLVGQRANSQSRKSFQVTYSESFEASNGMVSNGSGQSREVTPSLDFVQIPAALHGAFSLNGSTSEQRDATAIINVDAGPFSGGGTITTLAEVTARVSPSALAATSPAALPTSGLYLWKLDVEPADEFGFNFIHATVFDFASA